MTPADFEREHRKQPFNPFTIHLSNGRFYPVPTPEFVAHKPGSRLLFVFHVGDDGNSYVDLDHVVEVTTDQSPLPADPR